MSNAAQVRATAIELAEDAPAFSESVLVAVGGARRILVATDDGHRPAYARARRAAIRLAEHLGAELILYDRSAESRFVDPYPSGGAAADAAGPHGEMLLGVAQLRPLGRAYLIAQITAAAEHEVPARAWLPLHRGTNGIEECAVRFGADVVVLPDELEHPSLVDRLRRRSTADLAAVISAPTLLVGPDGQVRVAGAWRVDRAASSLRFTARQFRLLPVRGRFVDYALDLDFDETDPTRSSVEARIAAASIRTGLGIRDGQLRSARFLDAAGNPEANFRSAAIVALNGRFRIYGFLTLVDQARPVVLEARIEPVDRDQAGRRRVRFRATTTLPWRDWGLRGAFFVGPELTIEIDILATEMPDSREVRAPSGGHFSGRPEPTAIPTAPRVRP